MFYRLLFVALTLLWFSSCKSSKNDPAKSKTELVSLETHPCRGYCPIFKLKVLNNGDALYEGVRFVEKTGGATFKLSDTEMAKLRGKLADVNLWQYPERFQSTVMDAPSATLTIYAPEKSHSVTGSIDRPKPLVELENLLKDITEAHGIKVKRGVDPNEIPEAQKGELLVKLKPDVNAGNWVRDFDTIKLRLVRRTGAENIWLVAYDAKNLGVDEVILILKTSKDVLEAQGNHAVSERN